MSNAEQGAKYINLKDPAPQEFTAMGSMEAEPNGWYVPKTEVDYQLWNRLTGVHNLERLGEVTSLECFELLPDENLCFVLS